MPPRKNTTTSRKNYNTYGNYATYGSYGCAGGAAGRTCATAATFTCNSPRYKTVRNECQLRIGSYRNVYTQFTGAGMTTWSPIIANRWMRYVNNGWQVFKFTNTEFCHHFGTQYGNLSAMTARRQLAHKFGACVKDVTKGKGNCWLIATTRTPTARPFANYDWC
jgi:hypothetical protein